LKYPDLCPGEQASHTAYLLELLAKLQEAYPVLRRRLAGLTPIVTSLKIRVETGDLKGDITVQNDSDEDHTLDEDFE
jgi:hypothetical protein